MPQGVGSCSIMQDGTAFTLFPGAPIAHNSGTHDNRSLMPNSRLKRTKIGISPSTSSWCLFCVRAFVLKSNNTQHIRHIKVKTLLSQLVHEYSVFGRMIISHLRRKYIRESIWILDVYVYLMNTIHRHEETHSDCVKV